MSEHLDLDALADVLAGLERPAHLDGCTECQAALAALEVAMGDVTAALAALPDPEPPADLTARISAAIAQERRGTDPATTVLPAGTATAFRRRPRWVAPAGGIAAAAVLVVGGLLISQGGGGHGSTTAAERASRGQASIARNSTGTPYGKDGSALTGSLKALLKGHAPTFAAQTPALATDSATALKAASGAVAADPLATLRTTAGLASCLASLSDPASPALPLALDYATFGGQPALLVLLPSTKQGFVEAYFVGAGCTISDAHLLSFQRVHTPA